MVLDGIDGGVGRRRFCESHPRNNVTLGAVKYTTFADTNALHTRRNLFKAARIAAVIPRTRPMPKTTPNER